MVAVNAARRICAAQALSERGAGVRFRVRIKGEELPAFAVRFAGRVYAYVNQCAHRGVELDWMDGRFFDAWGRHLICATHGARYTPDGGYCAGGPCAGRRLVPVAVSEREGEIFLDSGDDIDLIQEKDATGVDSGDGERGES